MSQDLPELTPEESAHFPGYNEPFPMRDAVLRYSFPTALATDCDFTLSRINKAHTEITAIAHIPCRWSQKTLAEEFMVKQQTISWHKKSQTKKGWQE